MSSSTTALSHGLWRSVSPSTTPTQPPYNGASSARDSTTPSTRRAAAPTPRSGAESTARCAIASLATASTALPVLTECATKQTSPTANTTTTHKWIMSSTTMSSSTGARKTRSMVARTIAPRTMLPTARNWATIAFTCSITISERDPLPSLRTSRNATSCRVAKRETTGSGTSKAICLSRTTNSTPRKRHGMPTRWRRSMPTTSTAMQAPTPTVLSTWMVRSLTRTTTPSMCWTVRSGLR